MARIIFVGPFGLQPKSTMRVRALPLAKALSQRGHAVTLLIPPWDDPDQAGRRWTEGDVQVINLPLPARLPPYFTIALTWTLFQQALVLQPDVIHFFKPKAYAGLAHWAAVQWRRQVAAPVRLVVDTDDWEQAWNVKLAYPLWQQQFFAWQERWGLSRADAVTVASRALERLAWANGAQAVFYLPNGVPAPLPAERDQTDREAAQLVRLRWDLGQAPSVLLLTRFVEFRLERIVSVIRRIAARLPETRWLIVGTGLSGEEEALKSQLHTAGLGSLVRFVGWVPRSQLRSYIRAADVAVAPFDDTLINQTKCSVKVIELLAAGAAVVADAVGQNCEYIESGVSGLLSPPEDDGAFSQAIVTLLTTPELRESFGRQAVDQMFRHFNWSRLAQRAEAAYEISNYRFAI